jgi:xylulose-5-phosphate/fructose-6-phosphate phosphoketolase
MVQSLKLPNLNNYEVSVEEEQSSTKVMAVYLRDVIKENPDSFRVMSPDETESNKLHSLFEITKRRYIWPVPDESENIDFDGRVMEMLSEHTLQGWMEGYVLTGRNAVFVSYEAFMMIIASMVDQYSKFIKQSKNIGWRKPLPSLNFVLTSTAWRQDHNGFSHQNPGFISSALNDYTESTNIYFPPDSNTLLTAMEECFKSQNMINIVVAGKTPMSQSLTFKQAKEQTEHGMLWWKGAGNFDKDPDIVFTATGDYATQESIASIRILKKLLPDLYTRFISVSELTSFGLGDHCKKCTANKNMMNEIFTRDRPVIYSYHGYSEDIKSLIFGHDYTSRFHIFGYKEKGTTTTPFDMQVVNECSRFHLAKKAIEIIAGTEKLNGQLKEAKKVIDGLLDKHTKEIRETGMDIDEIRNFEKYF